MLKVKYVMLIGALFFISGCHRDQWMGIVYPHGLSSDEHIGLFSTLEQCRTAALQHIREKGYSNADYECGLNCKLKNFNLRLYSCQETKK